MARKYQRKPDSNRGRWTEENLKIAIEKFLKGEISKRTAYKSYGIPPRTLTRRMLSGNMTKGSLGPDASLGSENEKRLAAYIRQLAKVGFPPTRIQVRRLAYEFAERTGLKHKFSSESKMAGNHWLASFLERNKELSIRQSEGLSVARAAGMNRKDVESFFDLLETTIREHNLFDKPQNIFNVDESGIQLINKPGKVVTEKGAKNVGVITPREKGETISLIACCSAEGRFLPPVLIMKGVNKKAEFVDGMPAGSDVYMSRKSAYVNNELFLKWFKGIFLPRKPTEGKTLLILDGHASHCSSIELLEEAEKNNVMLFCLPSHTTQALQPLDRSFFKPLKSAYGLEAQVWINHNKDRVLTRYQVGHLIGKAWNKAATVGNATSGFKACGIFPLNRNSIPDYFFAASDSASDALRAHANAQVADPQPSTSGLNSQNTSLSSSTVTQPDSASFLPSSANTNTKETPTKILKEIQPLPTIPLKSSVRKRFAQVLTSPENIKNKKTNNIALIKSTKKTITQDKKNPIADEENKCAECWENYFLTKSKSDWIQCSCKKWLHESCTIYSPLCLDCGRAKIRNIQENSKK